MESKPPIPPEASTPPSPPAPAGPPTPSPSSASPPPPRPGGPPSGPPSGSSPPTPPAPSPPAAPSGGSLRDRVVDAIRRVYDPEIPVNIYDIGLIYGIELTPAGAVDVRMTLTSPACPSAEAIPVEVEERLKTVPGITAVKVQIVWDPPWTPEKMSDEAKLQLGFF